MKVVIIGGVAGGATAAARLRRLDEKAQIIILERGSYVSYANCGLPYYIGKEIQHKESLTLQTPESFQRRFNIEVRLRNEAVSIDKENKTVTVKNHETGESYTENYDKLILSPGAEPLVPPLEGIEDKRIFTLRTIPDTFAIDEFITQHAPKKAVVVGGGFIGVEMAENLANRGMDVSIVEMAPHLLAPIDFDIAAGLHHYLTAKGVSLYLNKGVKGFKAADEGLQVMLENGCLAADLVILSIGVRPETALVKQAGIATNNRGAIVVDQHMRTSDENIYAAGDAVEITNFVTGQKGMVPLAGPANRQARIVADNICGIPSTYKGTQGSAILKAFDMTVASTGLNERDAKAAGIDYEKVHIVSASHATYYPGATSMNLKVLFEKASGKVIGAQIAGFDGVDKRMDVLAVAIRAGLTIEQLTELELCYAPPFSSAKDPVNMAGYVAQNLIEGKINQYSWNEVDSLPRDGSITLLDVRTPGEFSRGHFQGATHIPLDDLRQRMNELDKTKPVYVNCQSGLRSYIACRILGQNGFTCYNLSGGYQLYATASTPLPFDNAAHISC